jgi:GrpB-like predicted nucleotidyltransferase (UPF0157 family)
VTGSGKPRRPDVTALERVGGPEALAITLHDYDSAWVDRYVENRERIRAALTNVDVDIEHIGSTSVPGLAAKPIIDIVVAVDDITAEEDYLDALLAAGYELRVRERDIASCGLLTVTCTCTSTNGAPSPSTSISSCATGSAPTPTIVPSTRARNGRCSAQAGTT